MISLLADTHAAVWYIEGSSELSAGALSAIKESLEQGDTIGLIAISVVELTYLIEKQRISPATLTALLDQLDNEKGVLELVVVGRREVDFISAISRARVPDMPDRIIAATALALGVPLVTRDRQIKGSGPTVIW